MISDTRSSRGPALLLVPVFALSLVACGSSDDRALTRQASSSPTASASPEAEATVSASDSQLVDLPRYGVSYRIPESWVSIDAKKMAQMLADREHPDFVRMAKAFGMSVDQFTSTLRSSVKTMAVSTDGADDGFVTNINTSVIPAADVDENHLTLSLAAAGGRVVDFEHPSFGENKGMRMSYVLKGVNGTIQGAMVAVVVDRDLVQVFISARSRAEADRLADQVEDTLDVEGTGRDS